jgi:predicted nucleic acid-binding protein
MSASPSLVACPSVENLVQQVMKSVEQTLHLVKNTENEIEEIRRYDTRKDYSMGFWDGFFYGATLVSTIMFCAICYLR